MTQPFYSCQSLTDSETMAGFSLYNLQSKTFINAVR